MLKLYHGPLGDLSKDRLLTDLGQLWCADPCKRRFLRMAGVEEETVLGKRGRYPFVLAYLDHLSGKEEERAMGELGAMRLAPGMLCHPEDLWDGAARRLEEGWTVAQAIAGINLSAIAETGSPAIGALLPLMEASEGDFESLRAGSMALGADLSGLYDSPRGEGGDLRGLIEHAGARLRRFADEGCRHSLLTVGRGFPPCHRRRAEELDQILRTDPRHRREDDAGALSLAILFALLPELRRLGMTLLLRAGGTRMGDGWVDCGCDASSIGEVMGRLASSGDLPRTVLLPGSAHASMALSTLCGIFPSVDGASAVEMRGDVKVYDAGRVLALLTGWKK